MLSRLSCSEYKDDIFCLHGLNAIYLKDIGWYKVDARGNKDGVNAQFNLPIIVAPMTSKGFYFIFRPSINFQDKNGLILLDQIRAVDKSRLVKKIGIVDNKTAKKLSDTLVEMFEY